MEAVLSLETFDVRVKRIKAYFQQTATAIFDAAILSWRPRKKEWFENKQKITCIGYFYGLVENDHFHIKAREKENPIYGPQWYIHAAERVQPGTEVELLKFLSSIKGIGPKSAKMLIQTFGLDVISTITRDQSQLDRLSLSQKAKENLYQVIVENQSFEQLLIFLQLHGLSPCYTAQIYGKYGKNAIDKICDNPYSLYLDNVLDFPAADRLNRELGGSRRSSRVSAGMLACLREDAERRGNLFVPEPSLKPMLQGFLNRAVRQGADEIFLDNPECSDALSGLIENRFVISDPHINDSPAIYLASNYFAERKAAARLYDLTSSPKSFFAQKGEIEATLTALQQESGFFLADGQRDAIQTALTSPVSILTGGPGTGKTQTLTMLIQTAKRLEPDIDICICAPTGKAAVRVQELTGLKASTIHRAIGFPNNMLEEDELVCDLLLVDEFSMCDMQLCSWLFKSVSSSARVVIVGDHEQLPSVGPGLVLRDMIQSGVIPVTRLEKVFRQASNSHIIQNAHTIRKARTGQTVKLEYSKGPGGDFYWIEAKTQSEILRMIQKSVRRMLQEGFPMEQIEVLSSIHDGLIGSDNLNAALQKLLNPNCKGCQLDHGVCLNIGDKVIQMKNDYDLAVFNGETGIVRSIPGLPDKTVQVSFPQKDVWYDMEQVENLDLAYAITTHRAQGSEFQAVIIPVHESILYNMNKNLLYTAITRAKKRVVLIGTSSALEEALQRSGSMQRNSNFIPRLQSYFPNNV